MRPTTHALRYRLFQLLIDLDELGALDRRLRWFSADRFNLFSFHERDHGDGGGDLKGYRERARWPSTASRRAARCGCCACRASSASSSTRSLSTTATPRTGGSSAMIYEVNNTFGDRHSYLIPVTSDGGA